MSKIFEKFWRPRYPHMSPTEQAIWDSFLKITKLEFIRVEYDVRVGPGYVPEWLKAPNLVKMSKMLTQLRIDAVGETKDEIWIFEVKPRAGRSALGQLESYGYWYIMQLAPRKPVRLAVVCRFIDPNMVEVFEARGISVFMV